MKVYLDTCILSRLLDLRIKSDQLNSLDIISSNEDVEFVTSPKTLQEFENTTNENRRKSLRILFKIIKKIYAPPPVYSYSGLFGGAPFGVAQFGGGSGKIINTPYDKLIKYFDKNDAAHIYFAIKSKCDYFLTLDNQTIIDVVKKNSNKIKKIIEPMKIVNPAEMVRDLSK